MSSNTDETFDAAYKVYLPKTDQQLEYPSDYQTKLIVLGFLLTIFFIVSIAYLAMVIYKKSLYIIQRVATQKATVQRRRMRFRRSRTRADAHLQLKRSIMGRNEWRLATSSETDVVSDSCNSYHHDAKLKLLTGSSKRWQKRLSSGISNCKETAQKQSQTVVYCRSFVPPNVNKVYSLPNANGNISRLSEENVQININNDAIATTDPSTTSNPVELNLKNVLINIDDDAISKTVPRSTSNPGELKLNNVFINIDDDAISTTAPRSTSNPGELNFNNVLINIDDDAISTTAPRSTSNPGELNLNNVLINIDDDAISTTAPKSTSNPGELNLKNVLTNIDYNANSRTAPRSTSIRKELNLNHHQDLQCQTLNNQKVSFNKTTRTHLQTSVLSTGHDCCVFCNERFLNSLSNASDQRSKLPEGNALHVHKLDDPETISISVSTVTKNPRESNCNHDQASQTPSVLCKESQSIADLERKVSVVRPLKSGDHEAQKENDENGNIKECGPQKLDWNKIFLFLLRKIKPQEWRIFINILLGDISSKFPAHETVEGKVEQIRADNKTINDCILMCLQYWKQILADEASPRHISNACEQMGWNDVAQEFDKYMRNPPLLPVPNKHQYSESFAFHKYEGPTENTNAVVLMLPKAVALNYKHSESSNNRLLDARSSGTIIQEMKETCRTSEGFDGMYQQSSFATWSSGRSNVESVPLNKKRKISMVGIEYQTKKRKYQTENYYDNVGQMQNFQSSRRIHKRRSFRNCRAKRDKPGKIQQLEQCIIRLIEDPPSSSKPLDKVAYNTYLKETVQCILSTTQASKRTILSLKYSDYCDIDQFETKRKEKLYVIYAEDQRLTFGKREYEKLHLYVENARQNRIKELKETSSGGFLEPKALFINYLGEPASTKNVLTKRQCNEKALVSRHEHTREISESDTCSSTASCSEEPSSDQVAFGSAEESDISGDLEETRTSEASTSGYLNKNVEEVKSIAFLREDNKLLVEDSCTAITSECKNSTRQLEKNSRKDLVDNMSCEANGENANVEIQSIEDILPACILYLMEERSKMSKDIELD